MTDVSNRDDIIDSRDVIQRIEELNDERAALVEDIDDADIEDVAALQRAERALADWAEANGDELHALQALAEEASGYAEDWEYGAQLIRDSYFETYAQELCEDIGDIPKDLPSYIEIDWEATARNLQQDYTSVDFDGVTYWVR